MASISKDKTIKIWSLNEGKIHLIKTIKTNIPRVPSDLVQLKNDNLASIYSEYNSIKVWDPFSGKMLKKLKGHSDTVTGLAALKNSLASCASDGTIKIWNYITGK